jgi:predicted phosphoribosyltransferase
MMYFQDRHQAGEILAQRLAEYKQDTLAIVALSSGAVLVGEPIKKALGAEMTLMLSRDIHLPGEDSVIGTIDQAGGFTYNNMFSVGELEELAGEFHNQIDSDKFNALADIHNVLGKTGLMERHALSDKVVVVLSDGVKNGVAFDAAFNYLKPIRLKKVITAAPVASVAGVDRMHLLSDEIHVLNVVENYLDTNHYYEKNDLPSNEAIFKLLTPVEPVPGVARKTGRNYN